MSLTFVWYVPRSTCSVLTLMKKVSSYYRELTLAAALWRQICKRVDESIGDARDQTSKAEESPNWYVLSLELLCFALMPS